MSSMLVSQAGAPGPTSPVSPRSEPSIEDKFDDLFKRLFNNSKSISLKAEDKLAELGADRCDNIWHTERPPYTIGVAVFKEGDEPGIEVYLSKEGNADGTKLVEFDSNEVSLLRRYEVALYDPGTKKISPPLKFESDGIFQQVELSPARCDRTPDGSFELPEHKQINVELPYAFSIVVRKLSV